MSKYCGTLIYKDYEPGQDTKQDADYILQSDTEWGCFNISKILRHVYYQPDRENNVLKIKIMNGTKTLFNENGILLLKKIAQRKLMSYHISSMDLGSVLFNNVGNYLEIELDAPVLKGESYATTNKANKT